MAIRLLRGHVSIQDTPDQYCHLVVMLVSRPVMVNNIIRIEDSHGQ
jgi:hypothetical protein